VRKAAIQQIEAIKQMRVDLLFLAYVDLGAHHYNIDNVIHISNVAFHRMTDEEKHIEFCLSINIQPFLFNK
jgi:hypothetical protein